METIAVAWSTLKDRIIIDNEMTKQGYQMRDDTEGVMTYIPADTTPAITEPLWGELYAQALNDSAKISILAKMLGLVE